MTSALMDYEPFQDDELSLSLWEDESFLTMGAILTPSGQLVLQLPATLVFWLGIQMEGSIH